MKELEFFAVFVATRLIGAYFIHILLLLLLKLLFLKLYEMRVLSDKL